jgi:hypothetical protein
MLAPGAAQNTNVAIGTGSSPTFFGSSGVIRAGAEVRTRSTICTIGSALRVATATVFFVRLPLPFRAAGREVITLERMQTSPEELFYFDSTDPVNRLSM